MATRRSKPARSRRRTKPAPAPPSPAAVAPDVPPATPPPPDPPAPAPHIVATIDDLAAALSIGVRQVGYDLRAGMPGERGRYDVAAAAAWRAARKTLPASFSFDFDDDGQPIAAPQRRWQQAKAEREELKLAKERGELLPAADVAAFVVAHVTECKAHLEELPPAIAAALPEDLADDVRRTARESIDRQVRKCLETLAELARRQGERLEAGELRPEEKADDAAPVMPREIIDPPPLKKPAAKRRRKT